MRVHPVFSLFSHCTCRSCQPESPTPPGGESCGSRRVKTNGQRPFVLITSFSLLCLKSHLSLSLAVVEDNQRRPFVTGTRLKQNLF